MGMLILTSMNAWAKGCRCFKFPSPNPFRKGRGGMDDLFFPKIDKFVKSHIFTFFLDSRLRGNDRCM